MMQPTISVQLLSHLANCLELTGRSPEALLSEIGLERSHLSDPEGIIPLANFMQFFERAAEYARNPHFGLHAARLAGSDSLGPLSFLFMSAPDLREAFTSFTRYLDTMQQASRNDFREEGQSATFEYAVLDSSIANRRQDSEYSIGAVYNLAKQFAGGELRLEHVCFEHDLVGDYATYRAYFDCDVFFAQSGNSFSFSKRSLDVRGRAVSPSLHLILEDHLKRKALDLREAATLGAQVKAIVASIPLDAEPRAAGVAQQLGISRQTLNRRLRAEGISWRNLVREHRMNGAARLLRESQRDVADIALATGYAESASFIRSFRKRFGTTPHRFRSMRAMADDSSEAAD